LSRYQEEELRELELLYIEGIEKMFFKIFLVCFVIEAVDGDRPYPPPYYNVHINADGTFGVSPFENGVDPQRRRLPPIPFPVSFDELPPDGKATVGDLRAAFKRKYPGYLDYPNVLAIDPGSQPLNNDADLLTDRVSPQVLKDRMITGLRVLYPPSVQVDVSVADKRLKDLRVPESWPKFETIKVLAPEYETLDFFFRELAKRAIVLGEKNKVIIDNPDVTESLALVPYNEDYGSFLSWASVEDAHEALQPLRDYDIEIPQTLVQIENSMWPPKLYKDVDRDPSTCRYRARFKIRK